MDIDDSGAEPDTASTGWLQEAAIAAPVAAGQLPDGQACVVVNPPPVVTSLSVST